MAQGYSYGDNQCKENTAGTCNGCSDCRWSWPSDAPNQWLSHEAMCRCKPAEEAWSYGDPCDELYNMGCGADCTSCVWSWPSAEDYDSTRASCRCAEGAIKEIEWGGQCDTLEEGLCGLYCRECRWSWEATDLAGEDGQTADCRCKDWY